MSVFYADRDVTLHLGNVLECTRELPDASVHCVVTSPPYYSLRDYHLPPSVWGGDRDCEHAWVQHAYRLEHHGPNHATAGDLKNRDGATAHQALSHIGEAQSGTCVRCGAWLGCLGLEPTPELFIRHV